MSYRNSPGMMVKISQRTFRADLRESTEPTLVLACSFLKFQHTGRSCDRAHWVRKFYCARFQLFILALNTAPVFCPFPFPLSL